MGLSDIAGWVAPAATMLAASMTAANLGARITGWGFVVFAVGSMAWTIVAIATGQQNLLWTNGFLLIVNAIGIWRWLGRQARYEQGSKTASEESQALPAPTLVAIGSLAGRKLLAQDGTELGAIVEAMMRCDGAALAYAVVSEGGVGGVGERLHAVPASDLQFGADDVRTRLSAADLAALPVLEGSEWPARLGEPGS